MQSTTPQAGTISRLLRPHPFFAAYDDTQLAQLVGHCELLEAPADTPLLALHELKPHIHFLLDGALVLEDSTGAERAVDAQDADARYPIARLRPSIYSVRSTRPSRLLAVEQSRLRSLSKQTDGDAAAARFETRTRSSGGSWRQHPLVHEIQAELAAQSLELPVIPAIAMKVRRALERPDMSLAAIGDVIAADPVISARLLEVANSPMFFGVDRCASLQTAVVRLGAHRVQNLVLALAMGQLFDAGNAQLRKWLAGVWKHMVEVAALCAALARINGRLDPEQALLSGLLHEVGKLPLLQRLPRHDDLMRDEVMRGDIVGGLNPTLTAAILTAWGLPDALVAAARAQQDWSYDHEGDCDLTDVLLVAHIHAHIPRRGKVGGTGAKSGGAYIGEDGAQVLPRLDETPAFAKITGKPLQPQESLELLAQVKEYKGNLQRLLA